jgi:trimeric autotransporter adhesin
MQNPNVHTILVKFYRVILLVCITSGSICSQAYLITNFAGLRHFGYSGDGGPATNAHTFNPTGVFADNSGNVYISDWGNARLREVTPDGIIHTLAGNSIYGYSGDGGPATAAELGGPMGIYVNNAGTIYFADIGNERIREINGAGYITTYAGNGAYGFAGDGGPAGNAEFEDPGGICGDASANIYVADIFNNRIRKISAGGIISTIAGCGSRGYSGDGGAATLAEFFYPTGVAVDSSGNLYIADENNNCIRKVNTLGIISTITGNGIAGYSGDGGMASLAELNNPAGIGVDNLNNIYITDGFNSRIRKINRAGIISTIAGNGIAGYSGIGDTATLASIYNPVSIAADTSGNIYFANEFNNFVQKLSLFPPDLSPPVVSVYPNPNTGIFTVKILNFNPSLTLEVYTILGQRVSYMQLTSQETQLNLSTCAKGIYIYRVIANDNQVYGVGKVVIL